MIDVNELRKGVTFELDGNLYKVLDYSHNKTGRGNANIRVKARNLLTGANIERTFSSGQSVQDVSLDFHNVSYLYTDGDFYHFMDNETFEQPAIKGDVLGDKAQYLKESMEVKLTFYKGATLKDPSRLFNSSLDGNARRAIDFHEGDAINEDAFRALIRAAVSLNAETRKR